MGVSPMSSTGILPVGLRGIGILPMIRGLEGAPNAAFCVGAPNPCHDVLTGTLRMSHGLDGPPNHNDHRRDRQ